MIELETRLAEGLGGTGERAPHPTDLASGARDRLRRRRRTTAGVVAAALAVVAVPLGLTLVGGDSDRDRPAPSGERGGQVEGDWQLETWHDLSVRVPPGWARQGNLTCVDGRSLSGRPLVTRPGGECGESGPGVHFTLPSSGELPPGTEGVVQQYRGDRYPDGSWIGYVATQAAAVWVVAEDRTTARQVLDSATPVGEVDANGCATRIEMTANSGERQVSVCRYGDDGWLEQSERLSGGDSAQALAAVGAAPGEAQGRPCDPGRTGGAPTVVLTGGGLFVQVVLQGPCQGIQDNSDPMRVRALTPEVLHWALSPGWSGEVRFLSGEDARAFRQRVE